MGKVIVSCYMSLDGVIENPMWTMPYWSDDLARFQSDDLFSSDALLAGRKTFEGFAEAWSPRAGTDAFADRINAMPKYVASRTMQGQTLGWNGTVIEGDAAEGIARLKQGEGMNILKYGGGELLATLMQHNLLDELHLLVYPVVVGSGTRLFPYGTQGKLQLKASKTFDTGVVALIYQPLLTP